MTGIYKHLNGSGTTVIVGSSCRLLSVVVGKVAASQTLEIHDCATSGAAAAGNLVSTIELDTREALPFNGDDGVWLASGLVAVISGGTPDVTVVYG